MAEDIQETSLADLIIDRSNYNTVDIEYIINKISHGHYGYSSNDNVLEFKNLIIIGEHNFLLASSSMALRFENCYFTKYFSLGDGVFEKFIEFKNCSFDFLISLGLDGGNTGVTVKGDLNFISCFIQENSRGVGHFSLHGGNYETINLSFYGKIEYTFYSGNFKLIDLGSYIGSKNIESIVVLHNENRFDTNSKFGDIKIVGKEIGKLYIGGVNKGNLFILEELKVRDLQINNFRNDGDFKVFGLAPLLAEGIKTWFSIDKSSLGKAQFFRIDFYSFNEIIIIDSLFIDSVFVNVRWFDYVSPKKGPGYLDFDENKRLEPFTLEELYQIRDTYRQLKFALDKQGDKVQEAKFYAKEMGIYKETIKWKGNFWDKIILYASDFFSKFGLSVWRPFVFLFAFNAIFCLILNKFSAEPIIFTKINNHSWIAVNYGVGEFFTLINPTHKTVEYNNGLAVFFDLFSRVSASFFLYNFIKAARRFVR